MAPCALCGAPAVWSVPGGCVAQPWARIQCLCYQHEHSLPDGALDGFVLLAEIQPPIN